MRRLAKLFECRRDPVDQALDQAVDRANDAEDEIHESQTDEALPFACVEAMGHAAGVQGAQADLAAGTVSSAGLSRHVTFDFDQACTDCGVDEHADHGSYTMPALSSARAAGLSVALQPSMANGGEAELLQARDLYQAAVDDGYRQTALESFQQQLDDRLIVNWNGPGDSAEQADAGRSDAFDIQARVKPLVASSSGRRPAIAARDRSGDHLRSFWVEGHGRDVRPVARGS
jgi:hypothetical protein